MQEYSLDCVVGRGPRSLKGGAQGGRDHGGEIPGTPEHCSALAPTTVGHIPRELSCNVWYALN